MELRRLARSVDRGSTAKPLVERLKRNAYQYRWELAFALAFLLVTLAMFRDFFCYANPLGTDSMGLPFIITASGSINDFFATWIPYSGLGFPDYPLPTYQSLYLVATSLGTSPLDIAKAIVISSFWLAGVAMFICSKRMVGGLLASIAAALIFCFNQVFLSQVIDGHYYFVLGYALFPIVFMVFQGILKGRRSRYDPLAAIFLLAYGTLAPPNIVLIAVLFLGLFALASYLMEPFPKMRLVRTAFSLALIMAFLGLSVVLANNIPTYNTSYPIQEAMHWSSHSLSDAFSLKASENSFFYGNDTGEWVQPEELVMLAEAASFAVPLLAFSSLLRSDRRKLSLPLATVALMFIFASKGPHEPLSGIFQWAFTNLPLLDTVRVFSRFSLFTSFAYGLMVAIFLTSIRPPADTTSPKEHIGKIAMRHKCALLALITMFIGACLIIQSGVVLTGAIGTFETPIEYRAPFDYIGEKEGDFRVLNLPFMADYHNGPSSFGYPNTTTIDPGIYSIMYTGKDTVYGSSGYDYWAYFDYAIKERSFGYKETSAVLGAIASMRYVVIQTHTSAAEREAFLNMHDLTVVAEFEGGGMVLENTRWTPRATVYSNISLVTGGRSMITTLAGMGLYEPSSEALIFLEQINRQEVSRLLNMTDHIFVSNGDLTELYMEMAEWPSGQSVMMSGLGAFHTTDEVSNWIQGKWPLKAGLTLNPTLYTSGRSSVVATVESKGEGSNMYLKLMRGPEAGNLTISMPGMPDITYDAAYPIDQMLWVKFPMTHQAGTVRISFTNQGGSISNLERLVVATDEEMAAQIQQVDDVLAGHVHKLVYVYSSGSWFGNSERTAGVDGTGISPINASVPLSITAGNLLDGRQNVLIVPIDGGKSSSVTIENEPSARTSSALEGEVFDLGELGGGETIEISTEGAYGIAVFSGDWTRRAAPEATVTYECQTSGSYSIDVKGHGPLLLQVSESYNSWWVAQAKGSSALHVPIGSIVNGFVLDNGSNTVTVDYQGETIYHTILVLMGLIILVTTSLTVLNRYKSRNKDEDGR